MKILMISCSAKACENMDWMSGVLQRRGEMKVDTIVKVKSIKDRFDKRSLGEIMKKAFLSYDAIVFFSAVGIAVRSIAPFIKSKDVDPAVIVLDEEMHFAISLLSGHLGGANEITNIIATASGATPIITTATDIEEKFSVDDFARRNSLVLNNLSLAKKISVNVLEGKTVGFLSDVPLKNLKGAPKICKNAELGVLITNKTNKKAFKEQLTLYPKNLYVGIGMKKGTKASDIKKFIDEVFKKEGLSTESIKCLATIDIKAEEPGLLKYAKSARLKLKTYSAKELKNIDGSFSGSDFVKSVTGVDNVCERAAIKAAKSSSNLIIKKTKGSGITLAVAVRKNK